MRNPIKDWNVSRFNRVHLIAIWSQQVAESVKFLTSNQIKFQAESNEHKAARAVIVWNETKIFLFFSPFDTPRITNAICSECLINAFLQAFNDKLLPQCVILQIDVAKHSTMIHNLNLLNLLNLHVIASIEFEAGFD